MLGIHRSYNGEAAVHYFKQALSKEDNYYMDQDVEALWEGKASLRLGLHGKKVTQEFFKYLVNNINPDTKERLTVRNADNRRAGFDLTFSAPKSISVMYATTKDPNVLEAHRAAYRAAMLEIEASMQTQANTKYGRFYEDTGNIIYAAFDHFTSRPNETQKNGEAIFVPDPQMHTHCYIPNITWNDNKNRYQALEMGNVHTLAPYFEAVYHAHLSHGLNQIRLLTRRTLERYEIEGVSQEIIDKFSNRTKLIHAVAKGKGITDPKEIAKLGALTRHSKNKSVDENELYGLWKERLSNVEYKALETIKGNYKETQRPLSVKEAIDRSLEYFLERNSAAQEKRVLAFALKLGYGHLLPKDVKEELDSRENILRSKVDTITNITTKEMVAFENEMIELATRGKGKFIPLNSTYEPKQNYLNNEQRKAINKILSSPDQVTILNGAAGSGKTSLLTEVKEGIIL